MQNADWAYKRATYELNEDFYKTHYNTIALYPYENQKNHIIWILYFNCFCV
jgi:hypothetical protein